MTEITEVPSPFCGIGTDDLTVRVEGLTLKVTANGCAVNSPASEQAITDTSPRVSGKEVSLEVAAKKAATLFLSLYALLLYGMEWLRKRIFNKFFKKRVRTQS